MHCCCSTQTLLHNHTYLLCQCRWLRNNCIQYHWVLITCTKEAMTELYRMSYNLLAIGNNLLVNAHAVDLRSLNYVNTIIIIYCHVVPLPGQLPTLVTCTRQCSPMQLTAGRGWREPGRLSSQRGPMNMDSRSRRLQLHRVALPLNSVTECHINLR